MDREQIETGLEHLEAAAHDGTRGLDPTLIDQWLQGLAIDGQPDQLARLGHLPADLLATSQNTAAHLFRALNRSGGALREALVSLRDAVMQIE